MERMTDEEAAQRQTLEAQMQAATDAIQKAVLGLLQDGEVDPRLIVLAMARMTGGLTAAAALAEGQDVEAMLGDVAEVMRQAGRDHHEELQAVVLPVAGSA